MTAAQLKELLAQAESQDAARTFAEVARLVGIGEATLTSRDRSADTVRRRGVVAWVLVERLGWTQAEAGKALNRTERQVRSLILRQK
jgi:hypothetical protein